ncbi:hypothetical protein THAOC_25862 [Thalassiosira oceanica]|uniref:Calmodulin n=1 Tax=Thalassiosira oceanica TaxID=159749 RepID=K0RLA5_THAOC|nr:hypothetical protein THAOC_25862 [Thalassiosira oceanica]|eukprot:EJK54508.1 hypothetical protein THAOC_25862 [Thalassiosira oceanica]
MKKLTKLYLLLALLCSTKGAAARAKDNQVATADIEGGISSSELDYIRKRRRKFRLPVAVPLLNRLKINPLERRTREDGAIQQQAHIVPRKRQFYATCMGAVLAWVSTATIFYARYYDWPIPQSFFYAVDAGMSIGFCTDVHETEVGSRAFTIVHILLGARQGVASRSAAVFKLILERDSFKKAFYAVNVAKRFKLDQSQTEPVLTHDEFKVVLEKNNCHLSDEEFKRVCEFYDPNEEGVVKYEYFAQHFEGCQGLVALARTRIKYNSPVTRSIAKLYRLVSNLFTSDFHRIYLIFGLWVAGGVTWGVYSQHWDVITATHFAVSALATGGLTVTLGLFARVLVEDFMVEEELAAISKPLTREEYLFASKSLCSTDSAIHLSDYIVLQLMRQGKLSMESFEYIKREYQVIDSGQRWFLKINVD